MNPPSIISWTLTRYKDPLESKHPNTKNSPPINPSMKKIPRQFFAREVNAQGIFDGGICPGGFCPDTKKYMSVNMRRVQL